MPSECESCGEPANEHSKPDRHRCGRVLLAERYPVDRWDPLAGAKIRARQGLPLVPIDLEETA